MRFTLLGTSSLPLQPQTMWIWHSDRSKSFIVGDERSAFAVAESNPNAPTPLQRDATLPPGHPCNLPIPAALYQEMINHPWHGFRFLDRAAHDGGVEGDLLRTLVFGPDYGHYLLHPATKLVLALRSGSMQLLRQSPRGFEKLDQTKTRGKAALAFAAHPSEPLIVYGDNFGLFHAHRIDAASGKFAKAAKIADKQRKASRIEFSSDGRLLIVGGMGYLATMKYVDGKFTPANELPISVRDFLCHDDGRLVIVNQGLHGIAAYRHDPAAAAAAAAGFAKLANVTPSEGAVQQTVLSQDGRYLGVTIQGSPTTILYVIEQN